MAHTGPAAALRGPRILLLAPIVLLLPLLLIPGAAGPPALRVLALVSLALTSLIGLLIIVRHKF